MGKQYECDLKILNEIFKNEPKSKSEVKNKFVNKKDNGKYNKTEENSFNLTYQTLHDVNVLLKDTINPKYYKAYKLDETNHMCVSLAGNLQEYRAKYNLFLDDLKDIYLPKEIATFKKIQKNFGRHLTSCEFALFEKTQIDEGKYLSKEDRVILQSTFKMVKENQYELLSYIGFTRNTYKIQLDFQIEAIHDLLNRFINDFQDKNPIEEDNTYTVPIVSRVKRVDEDEETGIKEYSVREPKKHNINEYVFKDTLKLILNKNLEELNTEEIYKIIDVKYLQYFDFDEDRKYKKIVEDSIKSNDEQIQDMKEKPNSKKANIVSDVVNALELLKIITSKKKTHKNYHICQIVNLDSKKYEISLLTKVETIENLLSGLRSLSENDIDEKDINAALKIFNYSAKKN